MAASTWKSDSDMGQMCCFVLVRTGAIVVEGGGANGWRRSLVMRHVDCIGLSETEHCMSICGGVASMEGDTWSVQKRH